LAKAPAFQFYASDFLSDERVLVMSLAERGLYVTLLCHAWLEGSIPSEPVKIARLVREPQPSFAKLWPAVEACFVPADEGRLVNPRQEHIRSERLAHLKIRQESGRLGGLAKAASSSSTSSSSILKTTSSAGKAKKEAVDPEWATTLRASTKTLGPKPLRDLTVDERTTLARYHCLVFGNCSADELKNRRNAAKVLAGLGGMAIDSRYGEMTVNTYVASGRKVTEAFKLGPWFDPWLIRGMLEAEAAK
jgi:uncharacterized protein YdaU (DUF1376 family)